MVRNCFSVASALLCRKQRGITLIELMVGVAVLAVLVTLAAPSFQRQMAASRLSAATNHFVSSLARARNEAIRTGGRVVVCRSQDGEACDTDAARHWEAGWILFQDRNSNGSVDEGEAISLVASALPSGIRIRGNQNVQGLISFRPSGRSSVVGTVRVCSTASALSDQERGHDIVLIQNGRTAVSPSSADDNTCTTP